MKYFYAFIFLLTINLTNAQYGQEGAILAVSEGVIRALELDQLNKIAQAQDDIVILHGLIAVTTADIVRIEQIKLDAESNLQPWVNNLSSVVRIGLTANQLVQLQDQILEVVQDVPQMIPFVTETLVVLIADSLIIVNDFQIALRENSTNLMSNKARMDIINVSQDGLDYLVVKSIEILNLMRTLAKMEFMTNALPEDFQIDYTQILQETQNRIDNLIIE